MLKYIQIYTYIIFYIFFINPSHFLIFLLWKSRFLSFLVNGINRSYINNLRYIKEDLEFSFTEYILCQMHLGILCHLLKRDLYVIYHVYRWLEEKKDVNLEELSLTLQWFYWDMSCFFQSISRYSILEDKNIEVTTPVHDLESLGISNVFLNFEVEREKVMDALRYGKGEYMQYITLKYKELVAFDSIFRTQEQKNRFAMSLILAKFSKRGEVIQWEKNQ